MVANRKPVRSTPAAYGIFPAAWHARRSMGKASLPRLQPTTVFAMATTSRRGRNRVAFALAKRLEEAEPMARTLVAENERLRERVSDLDQKQDRRSREFRDHVVNGIGEMLKGVNSISSAEIFGRLPTEVRREWLSHPEPLGVPTLTKKLKERSGRDRYVVKVGDK